LLDYDTDWLLICKYVFNLQESGFSFKSALDSEESSLETYLQRMSTEGTWGDGLMVSAASLLYNCPIHIHYVNRKTETIQHIALSEQSAAYYGILQMHLGFVDDNHYVSLQRIIPTDNPGSPSPMPASPSTSVLPVVSPEHVGPVLTVSEDPDIVLGETQLQESPNLVDIGVYATEEVVHIPTAVKLQLLKDPWVPPKNYAFPLSYEGKRNRKFNISWLEQFSWLAYSKVKEGAYCRHCVVFANRHPSCGSIGSLVITPLKRYKNAVQDFRAHESCGYHREAVEKGVAFLTACNKGTTVVQLANSALDSRMNRNRKVLGSIIESIIFCGRQNIALRGHRDDGEITCDDGSSVQEGNFRALLKFRMNSGDESLSTHLRETGKNSTMVSKTTQEQIIRLCGKYISDIIINEVKDAVYFSVLADETTDVSTKEQMALVLRYVKEDTAVEKICRLH